MVVIVLLLFAIPIAVMSVFATEEARRTVLGGMLIALPSAGLVLVPIYLSDRGYQVGWDDEGIYARMPGFRFEAFFRRGSYERDYDRPPGILGWFSYPPVTFMRYADIVSVGALPARGAADGQRRTENRTIYIAGTASPRGLYNDLIGVDLNSFKASAVDQFMAVLRAKRPEVMRGP